MCPSDVAPFEVFRDDAVSVTATLVQHPPIAPAFAFRFDTEQGSVTISGDTAPCANLTRLARGTTLLLHEAMDFGWVTESFGSSPRDTDRARLAHHRRSHTSPEDAGTIASTAEAGALALHHLGPASAHPSVWEASRTTYDGPFHVPNDLDALTFSERSISQLQPAQLDELAPKG